MEKALNIETSLPLPATPISPMPKSPLTGGGIQLSTVNGTLLQPESTLYMKRTTSSTNPYAINPPYRVQLFRYLQDTNATQQTPMVDPRIKMSSVRRQPKRLVFLNPGEITKKAEQDRHIFMQQQISQATKIEKGNIPSHLPVFPSIFLCYSKGEYGSLYDDRRAGDQACRFPGHAASSSSCQNAIDRVVGSNFPSKEYSEQIQEPGGQFGGCRLFYVLIGQL